MNIRKLIPLIILLINFQVFSQEEIPNWFLKEMQNDIGIWNADNSEYKNEKEPFDKYQIIWEWSIENYSLKGQLLGINNTTKSPVFWEFRKVWNIKEGKPKIIQIGMDGTYGVGFTKKIDTNENQLVQTFETPNGIKYKEGHKTIVKSNTSYLSTSYSISQDDKWEIKRSYLWVKNE